MLDQELDDLLRKNLEIAKDNNRMLRSMRRRAFWGGILRFVWWFVILVGLPLFAYYLYLEPQIRALQETYGNAKSGLVEIGNIGQQFKNIQENFKNYIGQ